MAESVVAQLVFDHPQTVRILKSSTGIDYLSSRPVGAIDYQFELSTITPNCSIVGAAVSSSGELSRPRERGANK